MEALLGFQLDIWDYLTCATLLLLVVAFPRSCRAPGLPGRIAIARRHPDAEAVNVMLSVLRLQERELQAGAAVIQLRNALLANRITPGPGRRLRSGAGRGAVRR